MRHLEPTRRIVLALFAALATAGCAPTVTTVRTIDPEEYRAQSWLGRSAADVVSAWGENGGREPDGMNGHTLTYRKIRALGGSRTALPSTTEGGAPDFVDRGDYRAVQDQLQPVVVATEELAKFWIGPDGKVYRFWFADEVYRKHLDAPGRKPVEVYGRKTP